MMMKLKIINSDWLWYGVILSVLPLVLVLGFYRLSGHKVGEIDYIPDLILVSFAVAVNLASSVNSSKLKNENIGKTCARISTFSWIICLACYYFLVGVAINLSEELLKLEMLVEENPESLSMVATEIKSFLNRKMDEIPWVAYITPACVIIFLSAVLGRSIEEKEDSLNNEECEQIVAAVREFLKESKNTLSSEDYGKVIADTKKFLRSEKLIVGAKQFVDEDAEGINTDGYQNIMEKAKQIVNQEGAQGQHDDKEQKK